MLGEASEHIISLDQFAIGYQKDHALLSELNLTVNRGEMVALIGQERYREKHTSEIHDRIA